MNRQNGNGMISSLVAIGAAGMAIYSLSRVVKNKGLKQTMKTLGNIMAGQAIRQLPLNPVQGMMKPFMQRTGVEMQKPLKSGNTANAQS